MSFVDDFSLSNYKTIEELHEARSEVESEMSVLRGYVRGIDEKIRALEDALADTEDAEELRP